MARFGCSLLFLSCLIMGAGCGGSGGGKTPDEAFQNMVEALKKEDMRGMMVNLTTGSQKFITGSIASALIGMKQFAPLSKGKIDAKAIDEVLKRHSVDEAKAMAAMKSLEASGKDIEKVLEVVNNIAAPVSDGPGFVDDAFKVMKGMKGPNNPLDIGTDAKLKDVTIDGDKAKGKVETAKRTEDIYFTKEGGAWKVDLIPMLRAKGF